MKQRSRHEAVEPGGRQGPNLPSSRPWVVIGYRPKTGRPVDANGNLLRERMYGPDPRSSNGKIAAFEAADRGSTPRRGTTRGAVEPQQGELL